MATAPELDTQGRRAGARPPFSERQIAAALLLQADGRRRLIIHQRSFCSRCYHMVQAYTQTDDMECLWWYEKLRRPLCIAIVKAAFK